MELIATTGFQGQSYVMLRSEPRTCESLRSLSCCSLNMARWGRPASHFSGQHFSCSMRNKKKTIFKYIFFHHRFHWRTLLPWHLGQVTAFRLPILFTLNLCDIVSIGKIFRLRCGFFSLVPYEKHRRGRAICSRLQVMYSGTPTELRNY